MKVKFKLWSILAMLSVITIFNACQKDEVLNPSGAQTSETGIFNESSNAIDQNLFFNKVEYEGQYSTFTNANTRSTAIDGLTMPTPQKIEEIADLLLAKDQEESYLLNLIDHYGLPFWVGSAINQNSEGAIYVTIPFVKNNKVSAILKYYHLIEHTAIKFYSKAEAQELASLPYNQSATPDYAIGVILDFLYSEYGNSGEVNENFLNWLVDAGDSFRSGAEERTIQCFDWFIGFITLYTCYCDGPFGEIIYTEYLPVYEQECFETNPGGGTSWPTSGSWNPSGSSSNNGGNEGGPATCTDLAEDFIELNNIGFSVTDLIEIVPGYSDNCTSPYNFAQNAWAGLANHFNLEVTFSQYKFVILPFLNQEDITLQDLLENGVNINICINSGNFSECAGNTLFDNTFNLNIYPGEIINLEEKIEDCFGPKKSNGNYIKCLNYSGSFSVTLYVDQPIPGNPSAFSSYKNPQVGHTFLSMNFIDGNSEKTLTAGFYPLDGLVNPTSPAAPQEIRDDSQHPYDVGRTFTFGDCQDANDFLINMVSLANTPYHLDNFNCTDFGIQSVNGGGFNVPDTDGWWPFGGGSNPGNLGEDIRDMPAGQLDSTPGIAPSTDCN